jgi:hypothetical protein
VKLTTHLHLVPRSKNEWSYASAPQYAFMAGVQLKHRDNFAFTLLGALIPGVRRPGRETDHSPLASLEIKSTWSYTSTLPLSLHDMVLS